jgi:hypothetical protein
LDKDLDATFLLEPDPCLNPDPDPGKKGLLNKKFEFLKSKLKVTALL